MNGRSPIEQLYLAQRLDLRLDELREQERTLTPEYAEAQERQAGLNNRLEDAEIELERLEKEISGLERALETSQNHLARNEAELEKAAFDAKAQTQYANVGQQLAERVSEYEEGLLPLKARRTELQEEAASLRAQHRELRPEISRLETEDEARIAALRAQGEDMRAGREQILSGLEPRLVHTYETLRRGKKGVAVAVIRGGACSACNMQLPVGIRQRAGKAVLKCPSCGRFLMTEEQANALEGNEA